MKPTGKTKSSKALELEPMMEVNMTPLIDVMLVLIIMLIITIPRQNDVLNLNMPTVSKNDTKPDIVTLEVDADGTVLWDGIIVQNRRQLEDKLSALVRAGNTTNLQLRPHKHVDYKFVASVMSSACGSKIWASLATNSFSSRGSGAHGQVRHQIKLKAAIAVRHIIA